MALDGAPLASARLFSLATVEIGGKGCGS